MRCISYRGVLASITSPIEIPCDNIIGIEISTSPGQYVNVFLVYFPCKNHSIDKFMYAEKISLNKFHKEKNEGIIL